MAVLTVQRSAGLTVGTGVALVAPTVLGDKFDNDGHVMLKVVTTTTLINVTVAGVPCSHGRTGNAAFACASGKTFHLGPFDKSLFNDANGQVNVTYDVNTGASVAAIRENS